MIDTDIFWHGQWAQHGDSHKKLAGILGRSPGHICGGIVKSNTAKKAEKKAKKYLLKRNSFIYLCSRFAGNGKEDKRRKSSLKD